MSARIGMMVLAGVGAVLLAAPVSAKTAHTRHGRHLVADSSYSYAYQRTITARRIYRPVINGPVDLSGSKHFDDQFKLDP